MRLRASDDPFPDDAMTVCQAAALARVSRKTISRRMAQGRLRFWREKGGRAIRLSKADVIGLWECRVPGGPRPRKSSSDAARQREDDARWAMERLGVVPG